MHGNKMIKRKIEKIRKQLHAKLEVCSLSSREIIELSRELDRLILAYYSEKNRNNKRNNRNNSEIGA